MPENPENSMKRIGGTRLLAGIGICFATLPVFALPLPELADAIASGDTRHCLRRPLGADRSYVDPQIWKDVPAISHDTTAVFSATFAEAYD